MQNGKVVLSCLHANRSVVLHRIRDLIGFHSETFDRIVDDRDVNADFSVDVKELDLGLKECTYTMLIPSTDLSDAGRYTLKVRNKFEAAESSVRYSNLILCYEYQQLYIEISQQVC